MPVSFRLPVTMAQLIKDKNWDLGQFVYNFLRDGSLPATLEVAPALLDKMVALMMNENVVAPTNFFTETEERIIRQVAERLTNE